MADKDSSRHTGTKERCSSGIQTPSARPRRGQRRRNTSNDFATGGAKNQGVRKNAPPNHSATPKAPAKSARRIAKPRKMFVEKNTYSRLNKKKVYQAESFLQRRDCPSKLKLSQSSERKAKSLSSAKLSEMTQTLRTINITIVIEFVLKFLQQEEHIQSNQSRIGNC